jgi:hypothetical protein
VAIGVATVLVQHRRVDLPPDHRHYDRAACARASVIGTHRGLIEFE